MTSQLTKAQNEKAESDKALSSEKQRAESIGGENLAKTLAMAGENQTLKKGAKQVSAQSSALRAAAR